MKKIDFKKKITVWNTANETYPIRTESGKGVFVIFVSLNERDVGILIDSSSFFPHSQFFVISLLWIIKKRVSDWISE